MLAGAGGAFDLEVVAVVQVEIQQRPDDHDVHRHPDRPAPVGVAAEHAGVRLARQVVHPVLLALHVENERVLLMELGERADAVGAEELVLVEHLRQDPAQPLRVDHGHDPPLVHAEMPRAGRVHGLLQARASGAAVPAIWAIARGMRSRCHFSMTVVAHRGRSPTMERTLSRVELPSGRQSRS